ncbi:MAG: phenylalanine--tRNA ligase subunit beta [Actinomycetota bacterium]|nr:phenylalanine--tRNA ligase subunit beta [Actinomycetota bacterium]
MKVLLSWLQEFAPVNGAPEEIGNQLSDLGLAVEAMTSIGGGLDGVVVARVLDLRPHPDADRIQLVDVDAGDGEALQICCGAFNMSVGDLVPLATLGMTMPNGMEIARRKMRGEWSNGMLCAAEEIGLGDDSEGIMLLDGATGEGPPTPGTPLVEALALVPDVLYDLEVNPNRPDAMSVAGVARDLAARQGVPFALPDPSPDESGDPADGRLSVEVLDPVLCGRFVARVLDGITIGPSSRWLANRLTALGMRPINNVVDVSNYVMLELGQPSHTYDLAALTEGGGAGPALRVRRAVEGETVETLDGVVRTLSASDGAIADGDDVAIGIAGIMGGASTEIGGETTSVVLEMAWWDPQTISTSSRRLGLRSEASIRFERGADPEVADVAMRRFAELLSDSGATLAPGTVDVRGTVPDRSPVRVRTDRVNALLGTDLSRDEMAALLEPIGFTSEPAYGDPSSADLDVAVPCFRPDSATEIDVVEEVARMHGYGRIARTVPSSTITGSLTPYQHDRRSVRDTMVGLGLDEVMPVPFLAPGDLERAGLPGDGVTVTNPLVAEESVMRASLRPGILKTLAYNASHRLEGLGVFEIGHVYRVPTTEQPLPDEREHLAVGLGGRDAGDAVATWSSLADALDCRDYALMSDGPAGLHPTRAARIEVAGTPVGFVGEVDPGVLEAHGIGERVGWLEVDLEALLALPHGGRPYRRVSRYPSSDIDLAFEVDDDTSAAAVRSCLVEAAGDLLADLSLFDVFRGAPVAEGRRSLAFTLRFQADDRTLTDAEVADVRQACIDGVQSALPAVLRG